MWISNYIHATRMRDLWIACHYLFTMLIFLDKAPSHCMGNFHVHDQDYHNTCTFFNSIYYNIRAYTISFKEIPASPCRNLLTLFNQRMEYSHGHKTEQQTCKETQPTPGSKHQRLHWPTSMGQSENAIFDPTLLDTGIKAVNMPKQTPLSYSK